MLTVSWEMAKNLADSWEMEIKWVPNNNIILRARIFILW